MREDATSTTSRSLAEALEQGLAFSEIKGLSEDSLEAAYATAYSMYESGQQKKAETIFKFLCFYDHYRIKFFLGLAACQQMQENWLAAIATYSYASILDSENPNPPLQAANCHLALGNYQEAASGYHAAQLFGKKKPEYAKLVAFAHVREEAMRTKLRAKKKPVNKRNK